jgi:hypothetical protein
MTMFGRRQQTTTAEAAPPAVNAVPIYEDVPCGHNDELKLHLHCGLCGATWSGRWEDEARNGVRRALYEGGVWIWRNADGYTFAYRCRCKAAMQNFPALQAVTDRMLALSQVQDTPGLAQSPEWLARKARGERAFTGHGTEGARA